MHHNKLKTAALFGGMWALLLAIGGGISILTRMPIFLLIMTGIGLLSTLYTYWNSATLALRSMNAQPVTEQQQPAMYRIVRELSTKAGQPMPSLYVAPTPSPNAFATGRNPQNAAVCCTQGILDLLDERELRGVLAHELMHVYNRDILTSSIAAALGGLITSIAQYLLFFGGAHHNNDDRENNGLLAGLGALLLALLAPIATTMIQFAISRTREYDADQDGAHLCADPLALASALYKLEHGVAAHPLPDTPQTEQVSFMMIANPFGNLKNTLSTHPPTADRIRRLEEIAGYH